MYKVDIKCPKCKNKIRAKVYNEVSNSKIPDIINGDLFKIECSNCNEVLRVDYPIKLEMDNYLITYNITDVESDKKIRITESFDDFKEKILIFSDNYNDVLIEYIKKYIKDKLELKDKTLRYDSSNETMIIFTIIEDGKNVGIPIELYEAFLSKAKIKENNIIDKNNYFDFIKI